MTFVAAVVVLVLSQSGYWIGEQENTITVRRAVRGGLPAAVLSWQLSLDDHRLAEGAVAIDDDADVVIRITPPAARVRLPLTWAYQIRTREGLKSLGNGQHTIHLFPAKTTLNVAQWVKEHRPPAGSIVVWEHDGSLAKFLNDAAVPFTSSPNGNLLQYDRPSIVFVNSDMLEHSTFDQVPLTRLAESGTTVVIFSQSRPKQVMRYTLLPRRVQVHMAWRMDHPLLRELNEDDLNSWLDGVGLLGAICLPTDKTAFAVARWPRDNCVNEPASVDALLVSESIGKGQLLLCQIPLGDWGRDPRSRIFLSNILEYVLSQPQTTGQQRDQLIGNMVPERNTFGNVSISGGENR